MEPFKKKKSNTKIKTGEISTKKGSFEKIKGFFLIF